MVRVRDLEEGFSERRRVTTKGATHMAIAIGLALWLVLSVPVALVIGAAFSTRRAEVQEAPHWTGTTATSWSS